MKPRYSRYFTYIAPVIRAPLIKTYGSFIMTIILLIVFIIFAIKPTIETILVLNTNLNKQKDALSKLQQKNHNLGLARKAYQKLQPEVVTEIEEAVPKSTKVETLIKSLKVTVGNTASISALQLQPLTIEPSSQNLKPALDELQFTFNVEGQYQNLLSILQKLRTNSRLVSIKSITFSKLDESGSILMSLNGVAYYIK